MSIASVAMAVNATSYTKRDDNQYHEERENEDRMWATPFTTLTQFQMNLIILVFFWSELFPLGNYK